jgi:hypothetical protein
MSDACSLSGNLLNRIPLETILNMFIPVHQVLVSLQDLRTRSVISTWYI